MARFSLVIRAIHRLFSSFWPRVENSLLSSRYLASFSGLGGAGHSQGGGQSGDPVGKQPHQATKKGQGGEERGASRDQGDRPRKPGTTFKFPATPIPKSAATPPVKDDPPGTGASSLRQKQQMVSTPVTQSPTSAGNDPPRSEASQSPQRGKPKQVRVDPFRFRFLFTPGPVSSPTPMPAPTTMSKTVSDTSPSHDAPRVTKPSLSNLSGPAEKNTTPIVTQHKTTSGDSAVSGLVSDDSSPRDVTSQNVGTSESTRPVFGRPSTPSDIVKKLSSEAVTPRPVFGRPPTPVAESKETTSTPRPVFDSPPMPVAKRPVFDSPPMPVAKRPVFDSPPMHVAERPVFGRPSNDKPEKQMSTGDAEISKPIFFETHKPITTVKSTSGGYEKHQEPKMTSRFTVTPPQRPQGSQARPKQTPKEIGHLSPPASTQASSTGIFFTRTSTSVPGAQPAESAKSEPKASSRRPAAPPVKSNASAFPMSPSDIPQSVQDQGQFSDKSPVQAAAPQQSSSSVSAPPQRPSTPSQSASSWSGGGSLPLTHNKILPPLTSPKTTFPFKSKAPPKGPQAPPSPAPPKSPRTEMPRVRPDPPFLATPHLQEQAKLAEQKTVLRNKFRAAARHMGGDMQEALELAEREASKHSWTSLMPKEPQVRDPPKDAPGQKQPPKEAPGDGNAPAMKADGTAIDPPARVPPNPPRQPVANTGWYHAPEYFEHQPTTFYDVEVEISKKRHQGTADPDRTKDKGKGYKNS